VIEVVVTLAVVTIVLASIASLVASAANGTRTLEQHVALVETARLVTENLPRRLNLPAEKLVGEVSGHRWQVRILPLLDGGQAIPDSSWVPQSVAVRVQSPSGAMLTVETIRLQKRPAQ
jgi:general secretion pathway protein I